MLVTDIGFQNWAEEEFGPNVDQSRKAKDVKKICDLAKICAALKCAYGGGSANPVCNTCVGMVVGCLLLDWLGAFD